MTPAEKALDDWFWQVANKLEAANLFDNAAEIFGSKEEWDPETRSQMHAMFTHAAALLRERAVPQPPELRIL